ncbi:phospho-N-acetylmuramoyl-pentapeptide-transferase [Candidatus Uhrbacteria bacterium]|nr:phospho-N-acetylmuramoyl-pentapeptide-transferase [Candidatus Uhrbacteria bacterium]
MVPEAFEIVRILLLTSVSFLAAFAWTPLLLRFLQTRKLGKRIRDSSQAPVFSSLHAKKSGTPTMGGVVVWATVLVLTLLLAIVGAWFPDLLGGRLNFLSRSQTLLPLGVLVASALVGLVDDYLNIRGVGPNGGGLRVRHRLMVYTAIAIIGAWWFAFKLDWDLLHVPFVGNFNIGWWYIPFFIMTIVATSFSVNETDGLDGLAGGTLLTSFGAFAVIAFAQGKYDLAALCAAILGALLAFLWFNIHPARFMMGDTGAMSLGVTLGVVALLTNSALLLPLIGFPFVLESVSVLLQLTSKHVWKRKVFLSAPIHHHLEAKGWPEPQIVMRFWVISMVSASLGVAVALLDAFGA